VHVEEIAKRKMVNENNKSCNITISGDETPEAIAVNFYFCIISARSVSVPNLLLIG
jgi:hypothetical protein